MANDTVAGLTVTVGLLFAKEFRNYPERDRKLISEFILHIQNKGFNFLEGLNKKSNDVSKNDPNFFAKTQYANKHNLWHYHIGIKEYDLSKPYGKRTSEYIVHYQVLGNVVRIVDYSAHPPFTLPSSIYLN